MPNRTAKRYADQAMQREIENDGLRRKLNDSRQVVARLKEDLGYSETERARFPQLLHEAYEGIANLRSVEARCLSILSEHLGTSHETLEDAVRNLAQAYVSERDSARQLAKKRGVESCRALEMALHNYLQGGYEKYPDCGERLSRAIDAHRRAIQASEASPEDQQAGVKQ